MERVETQKDSTGRILTKEQQEYFKDSKIRDENGNLKVLYHGTPFGEFNTFKGKHFFFSEDYTFAHDYSDSKSFEQGLDGETKVIEAYLKAEKVFDASNPNDIQKLRENLSDKVRYWGNSWDKETLLKKLQRKDTLPPKWKSEQIEGKKFGDYIGDDRHGYNTDMFVGINDKNEIVYIPQERGLQKLTDMEKSELEKKLINGEEATYTTYETIFGELTERQIQEKINELRQYGENYKKETGYDNKRIEEEIKRVESELKWELGKRVHKLTPKTATQENTELDDVDNWTYFETAFDEETRKDIFSGINSKRGLQQAALDYIIKGNKNFEVIKDVINGEEIQFRRISGQEYIYGTSNEKLSTSEYKQKMRIAPSIDDLINNAPIKYHSPLTHDNKNFPNGFNNYQGLVNIDDVLFRYIVRVGNTNKNDSVFYDVSLNFLDKIKGISHKVHQTNNSSSLINKKIPLTANNIPQSNENVKSDIPSINNSIQKVQKNTKNSENDITWQEHLEKNYESTGTRTELDTMERVETQKDNKQNQELNDSSFFNQKNSLSIEDLKQKQLDIILKENPMTDDYHTGIRTVDDIKTFDETIDDDESFVWGDFSQDDAKKALEKGEITVYSSYPIEQGVFVSTSKNQVQDYAGGNKIYSKIVPLNEVAWINGDEGQYAKVDNTKFSLSESPKQDSKGRTLTKEQQEYFKDSKIRDEEGRLLEVYHGTNEDFTVFDKNYIGSASGDLGFLGDGFYFATHSGEAGYYGNKNMSVYLNVTNPYDIKNLQKYKDNSLRGENSNPYLEIKNLVDMNPEWGNIKLKYGNLCTR